MPTVEELFEAIPSDEYTPIIKSPGKDLTGRYRHHCYKFIIHEFDISVKQFIENIQYRRKENCKEIRYLLVGKDDESQQLFGIIYFKRFQFQSAVSQELMLINSVFEQRGYMSEIRHFIYHNLSSVRCIGKPPRTSTYYTR